MTSLDLITSKFDELVRCTNSLIIAVASGSYEQEFLEFAKSQEDVRLEWSASVCESERLKSQLITINDELSVTSQLLGEEKKKLTCCENAKIQIEKEITENQAEARQAHLQFTKECERLQAALDKSNEDLAQSRQLFDDEKKRRCAVEDVKNQLEKQISELRELQKSQVPLQDYETLKSALDKTKNDLLESHKLLDEERKKHLDEEKNLSKKQVKVGEVQKKLSASVQECERLKLELENTKKESLDVHQLLDDEKKKYCILENEKNQLKKQSAEIEKKITESNRDFEKRKEDLESAEQILTKCRQELENEKKNRVHAENERMELKKQIAEHIDIQNKLRAADCERLERDLQRVQRELLEVRQQLEDEKQRRCTLEDKKNQLEKRITLVRNILCNDESEVVTEESHENLPLKNKPVSIEEKNEAVSIEQKNKPVTNEQKIKPVTNEQKNKPVPIEQKNKAVSIEQKNKVVSIEQKNIIVEQKNNIVEQKNNIVEQKNSIIEQKNSIIEQKNSIIEEQSSIVEQNGVEKIKKCRKKAGSSVKRKKKDPINSEINLKPDDIVDELLIKKRGRPKKRKGCSRVVVPPQKAASRSRLSSGAESNNDLKSPDNPQHSKKRRKCEISETSLGENSTKKPKKKIMERIFDSTSANDSTDLLPKEANTSPCRIEKTINENNNAKKNNIVVQDIIMKDSDKLLTNTLTEKNNIHHLPSRLELLVNNCPIVSVEKLSPKKKISKITIKTKKKN